MMVIIIIFVSTSLRYTEHLIHKTYACSFQAVVPYSVFSIFSLPIRASPKSQIFKSQFALSSKFPGFKSRWRISAEWMYLSPRSICLIEAKTSRGGRGETFIQKEKGTKLAAALLNSLQLLSLSHTHT